MGNNKDKDKIKIWRPLVVIRLKLFFERKPPEDMVVEAKLNESKSLMFDMLNKKITKIVENK